MIDSIGRFAVGMFALMILAGDGFSQSQNAGAGSLAQKVEELRRKDQQHLLDATIVDIQRKTQIQIKPDPLKLPNSALRFEALDQLRARQALDQIGRALAGYNLEAYAPAAKSLARASDFLETLKKNPFLHYLVAKAIAAGRNFAEVRDPEGYIGTDGRFVSLPRGQDTAVGRPSDAALRTIPTLNQLPDFASLKLDFKFVVGLQALRKKCTAAMISPTLAITARHCLFDGKDRRIAAADVRIVTSQGRAKVVSSTWIVDDDGQEGARLGSALDIALVSLAEPIGDVTVFAQLSSAEPHDYWAIMAGRGVTSMASVSGSGAVARQWVTFRGRTWSDGTVQNVFDHREGTSTALSPTPCSGDSGGPVFVDTLDGIPAIIGVLSAANKETPSDPHLCASAANGKFVDLGHRLVWSRICQRAGVTCRPEMRYVPRA